jgi:hypothetical protein
MSRRQETSPVQRYLLTAALAAFALAPGAALACACGCGVFDVGDGTFMPSDADTGVSIWVRDSYMDQDQNWEGDHKAPASDNPDKDLKTNFTFFGAQYVVSRDWTVMAELPVYDRVFTSTDDGTVSGPAGSRYRAPMVSLGDLELTATYTGLDKDMSTGIGFGLKLPTGNWIGPRGRLGGLAYDRDTLPGTGSTDLIASGYHVGSLNAKNTLSYFLQAKYQFAVATQENYRPGNELDAAAGVTWDLGSAGVFSKVAPLLQVVESWRVHDTGANADPPNSGYERVYLSPGLEVRIRKVRLYADVELPIYQHVNAAGSLALEGKSGQLVAPALVSLQVNYGF